MIRKILHIPFLLFASIFLSLLPAGCASDDVLGETTQEGGDALQVSAKVAKVTYTRNYQASGDIIDGKYYLTYPLVNNDNNVAEVDFDNPVMSDGIGTVKVPGTGELKWIDIGGGAAPRFYLDNVSPDLSTDNTDKTIVVFDPDENPYKAAVFDSIYGTNDLLWGDKLTGRNVKTLDFDLHHNMARVRVMVTVDRTNGDTEDLDLDNATVEITSINQVPLSYNRLDGSLELGEESENYTPLTVMKADDDDLKWNRTIENVDNNPLKTTYISQDLLLPPQALLEDVNRPRLVITMKNGATYTGVLPHAMQIADENHNGELSYPVALYFLKEYLLTIRTVITEEPPSLSFMPVYVVKWVDKGTFDLEAHQSGIYTPQEFYKLMEYYMAGREYQLDRYGYLSTPEEAPDTKRWIFDFWSSITLDYAEIYGKMKAGTAGMENFSFAYNNYRVYVKVSAEKIYEVSAAELYQIVNGTLTLSP